MWEFKGPRITKNHEREEQIRGLTLYDFKTYYKGKKTMWYCIRIDMEINGIELGTGIKSS